jgi:hypothetical protein
MRYLLMVYTNENGFASATPEQQKQGLAAYTAYTGTCG